METTTPAGHHTEGWLTDAEAGVYDQGYAAGYKAALDDATGAVAGLWPDEQEFGSVTPSPDVTAEDVLGTTGPSIENILTVPGSGVTEEEFGSVTPSPDVTAEDVLGTQEK